MIQKSNHYFAHGVISIIIQEMPDMKIIYFSYGNSKQSQEYQCAECWNIGYTRDLHSASFGLFPIKSFKITSGMISTVYWSCWKHLLLYCVSGTFSLLSLLRWENGATRRAHHCHIGAKRKGATWRQLRGIFSRVHFRSSHARTVHSKRETRHTPLSTHFRRLLKVRDAILHALMYSHSVIVHPDLYEGCKERCLSIKHSKGEALRSMR